MKALEAVQVGLISALAAVAVTFAIITSLPHEVSPTVHHHPVPTVEHHSDLAPLFVPPSPTPQPAPGAKVPVVPAEPWLPYGTRGILA